jgi:hypothetical protein
MMQKCKTIATPVYNARWRKITMQAIRIHTQLESEILHLPELKPMIGKKVEIIILEDQLTEPVNKELSPWDGLFELSGKDAVDPEAYKQLRAASMI